MNTPDDPHETMHPPAVDPTHALATVETLQGALPQPAEPAPDAPPTPEASAPPPEPPAPAPEPPRAPNPEAAARAQQARERAAAAWDRLANAKTTAETIHAKVKSPVKGGLLVEIDGYRGFLPASQVRVPKGTPIESLVNSTIPLKVIDVDEARKRVVVSHRRAAQEEQRVARATLIQSLKVGEERDATVLRLADFGAFVDLGGVDALIPASELAFERVEKPSDVVQPGDTFKVKVLRVEENGKKIAVSRKGALADPWRDHADIVRQGNVVEGTVIAKEPRLTVEIAPGVSGTIDSRDADPNDYDIGEKVEVSVRSLDYRNRRIRLSTLHSAATFSTTSFAPLGAELGRKDDA